MGSQENFFGSVGRQNNNNNPKFQVSAYLKIKALIFYFKKLVLLCQHKLHMKPTTSLCFVIQRCQVYLIFIFYVFYCILKKKNHIRRNKNSKKMKCIYVKSVLLFDLPKIRVGQAHTTKN